MNKDILSDKLVSELMKIAVKEKYFNMQTNLYIYFNNRVRGEYRKIFAGGLSLCIPSVVRKIEGKYFPGLTEQTRLLRYLLHGFSFWSVKENKRELWREIGPITSRSCFGSYWTNFQPISALDLVIGPRHLTCQVIKENNLC